MYQRNVNMILFSFLMLLSLWGSSLPLSYALESDSKQKILIESDRAELNRDKKISVFHGNVKIDQGTTHLRSDELTIYFDDKDKIKNVIAKGDSAHYQTLPEAGKPIFHASAKIIRYNMLTDEVELEGNAVAQQGENRLTGPHIFYNRKSQKILSAKQAQGRTTIVIDPQANYWRKLNK